MKTKLMAHVLSALFAVACGKSDPEGGVPSCDFVLTHTLYSDGKPGGVLLDREALLEACRQSPWNETARACVQAEAVARNSNPYAPAWTSSMHQPRQPQWRRWNERPRTGR